MGGVAERRCPGEVIGGDRPVGSLTAGGRGWSAAVDGWRRGWLAAAGQRQRATVI